MTTAQVEPRRLSRARSVLLVASILVAALWVWIYSELGPWGRGSDWRSPVMVVIGVTGIVIAIVLRGHATRPAQDPAASRWSLSAIVVGSALGWSWMLINAQDDDPALWSYSVLIAGLVLLTSGSLAWRSLQALGLMLATSWAIVAAVCLKLTFWDGPRFDGPVCLGTTECIGRGLPAENAALLAFVFLPVMLVPTACQFVAVLIGEMIRPVTPTRPGLLGKD